MMDYRGLVTKYAKELKDARTQLEDARQQVFELETAAADANARIPQSERNLVPQCTEETCQIETRRAEIEQQSKKDAEAMRTEFNRLLKDEKAKAKELCLSHMTELSDLEKEHEDTVNTLKEQHALELETQQQDLKQEHGTLSETLKAEHADSLREHDHRHLCELRDAEFAHQHCAEDLRHAEEYTKITAMATPEDEDDQDSRTDRLREENDGYKQTVEQLRAELQTRESAYEASMTTQSQMQKDLDRASEKEKSNLLLIGHRGEEIDKLTDQKSRLESEIVSLKNQVGLSRKKSKELQKELDGKKQGGSSQANAAEKEAAEATGAKSTKSAKRTLEQGSIPSSEPKRAKTTDKLVSSRDDDEEPGKLTLPVGRGREEDNIKLSQSQRKT